VPLVKQIAGKYKKHVLSLLLRWGIQRGNSCLAKSSNPHHIRYTQQQTFEIWIIATPTEDPYSEPSSGHQEMEGLGGSSPVQSGHIPLT